MHRVWAWGTNLEQGIGVRYDELQVETNIVLLAHATFRTQNTSSVEVRGNLRMRLGAVSMAVTKERRSSLSAHASRMS